VASVYKQIPEGQHCMCKDWPGVLIEKKETETPKKKESSGGSASTGGEVQSSGTAAAAPALAELL
jgi:hypothetical protein